MLELLSRNAKFIIAALMLAGCTYLGYSTGYDKADLKWKEVVHNEYVTKEQANKRTQSALNEVSKGYQEDLASNEANAAGVIDGLNASNKRLRVKLASTGTTEGDRRCFPDGKAELHRETSEALIRITLDADAHVKALQDTVRALQGKEVQ